MKQLRKKRTRSEVSKSPSTGRDAMLSTHVMDEWKYEKQEGHQKKKKIGLGESP